MNSLDFLSPTVMQLFKNYVELDTSLPSGEKYPHAISLLDDFLKHCGFDTRQYPIPEETINKSNRIHLIARRIQDKTLPTLLIYNHVDVVPATYPNAFKLTIKDNRVWGRGTADHKGSTIAVLSALEALKDKKLTHNLIVWATTDEETDQLDQLRYMVTQLDLPPNTIIFDPDTFAGGVTIGNLGAVQFDVTVHGKSAHSGMSNLGVNAVEQASQLISEFFLPLKSEYEAVKSSITPFPGSGVEFMCNRCNLTMMSGGTAANVVPSVCTLTIDCRYIPEADTEAEKQQLLTRVNQFAQEKNLHITVKDRLTIWGHAAMHPFADLLSRAYQHVGGEAGIYGVMGSTPLAHWAVEQALPHVGLGVARADSNIHGENESAQIDDIYKLSKTLEYVLIKE